MHKVKVGDSILYAQDGALLHDVLIGSGKHVEHPCGGRGVCRKCTVTVDGEQVLSCLYRITHDITVVLPEYGQIESVTGADTFEVETDKVCYVLDIGTTTLALALVSLENGKIVRVITDTNPQRVFGADVISRIDYCTKNGVEKLHKVLLEAVEKMMQTIGASAETLYIAGNTTMLHMFFGVDCASIGVAPYTPVFLENKNEDAANLGLTLVKNVISMPNISAFVGADIVAGLNLVGAPMSGKHDLLIDLGTNAEVVLFSENDALCTAAAAGPCFEGANISCGMSATAGAISAYGEDGIKTIADAKPLGICGTGLVDVIAVLLERGEIDETGFMECESYTLSEGVTLEGGDVRQYQLAKSAVNSAILTLMKLKNVGFEDIGHMYISGGFSAKINIKNAVKTGLLPKELESKCVTLNNSSLLGAVKYAFEQNELSWLLDCTRYIDLSSDPDFSELFIENMMFE